MKENADTQERERNAESQLSPPRAFYLFFFFFFFLSDERTDNSRLYKSFVGDD
jgi:hypothetical protein